MLGLVTVWLLSVMPVPTDGMPAPKEFVVENVTFSSIEDCHVAGRKWMSDLTQEAQQPEKHHTLVWGRSLTVPDGATVTFSCIERQD